MPDRTLWDTLEHRTLFSAFTVLNTADGGLGSLRSAISLANADLQAPTVINFNIPGTGVHTIKPLSALPTITRPMTLSNASTPQAGLPGTGKPLVQINGSLAGNSSGLEINAKGVTVNGLIINGFLSFGIILDPASGADTISNCFIGVDPTGNTAAANGFHGIYINNHGNNQIIGNLVSGNANNGILIQNTPGTTVSGNYIGTNATGSIALLNGAGYSGLHLINATSTHIQNNLISGSTADGIQGLNSNGLLIAGNKIGTDLSGKKAIPNAFNGIELLNSSQSVISTQNVISGNALSAIRLSGRLSYRDVISGNFIGTDITGEGAIPNNGGINLNTDGAGSPAPGFPGSVVIGGLAADRNIISGNAANFGVYLGGSNNTVQSNYIGLDAAGIMAIPNLVGVEIFQGSFNKVIGNVISGNNLNDGVYIIRGNSNTIQNNYIGTNAAGTAAVGNLIGLGIDGGASNFILNNILSGNVDGISMGGASAVGNIIQGNLFGTDVTGTQAIANTNVGLNFYNGFAPFTLGALSKTLVGGPLPANRNIISASTHDGIRVGSGATGTLIEGNYIGTDISGLLPLGNGDAGILMGDGTGNVIGGNALGLGNVISANGKDGIDAVGMGNIGNYIRGNFIGTDATGTKPLGNKGDGIFVGEGTNFLKPAPGVASKIIIGGTTPGSGNIIAANGGNGIHLTGLGDSFDIILNNDIGTDLTGMLLLGNGFNGILIDTGASKNTIGPANILAFNKLYGYLLDPTAGTGNLLSGNNIYSNGKP